MSPIRRAAAPLKKISQFNRPVIAVPLVVMLSFAAISIAAYFSAVGSMETIRTRAVERLVAEDAARLRSSLSAYSIVAYSGAGFAESQGLSDETWRSYLSVYDLSNNFPAINSVAYDTVTDRSGAQSLLAGEAIDPQTAMVTLDNAKPAGQPYILVTYLQPTTNVSASLIGGDMAAYPTRLKAMNAAAASGNVTLTDAPEMIHPLNAANSSVREKGLLLFAPVYSTAEVPRTMAERQSAIKGYVHVSLISSRFFDQIFDGSLQNKAHLTIYQGEKNDADLIYQNGYMPQASDRYAYTQSVTAGAQTFVFDYIFSNSDILTQTERQRPVTLLLAGLVFGTLLAIVLLFSVRTRIQKLSFEKEREIQGAKDELLSLASHQLRTPATGVKQYMGMVLQGFAGDITEQQRDFLQKAYESNDRQLHIINDILHLAKLDAGRIVLTKTNFDMSELVASVIDEQSDSAHEAEITLSRRLPKTLEVYADSHMMRMVVENLISNAIKYTHPGGKVSVSLRSVNGRYELAVKDTGVGIAADDMEKLFKQFSRVANERSHLVSGTGVGLYLVKNLVELHGGSVSVSSKAGKGTTFTLSFPHTGRL